jgi:hypothetical protein
LGNDGGEALYGALDGSVAEAIYGSIQPGFHQFGRDQDYRDVHSDYYGEVGDRKRNYSDLNGALGDTDYEYGVYGAANANSYEGICLTVIHVLCARNIWYGFCVQTHMTLILTPNRSSKMPTKQMHKDGPMIIMVPMTRLPSEVGLVQIEAKDRVVFGLKLTLSHSNLIQSFLQ